MEKYLWNFVIHLCKKIRKIKFHIQYSNSTQNTGIPKMNAMILERSSAISIAFYLVCFILNFTNQWHVIFMVKKARILDKIVAQDKS